MNPTPLPPNEPADFTDLIDAAEPAGKREGLPANFRMRNAHYVDHLEAPPGPALKTLATSVIESDAGRDAPDALIASIRRHGVLEPLLVQQTPRGRHYRLIAGRKRLAAARAVGLRDVPCLVHAIGDAEAAELIDATRGSGDRVETAVSHAPALPAVSLYPAQRELEAALTTIESCTPLLGQTSVTARRGALQVIAAECRRSQRLLMAMRVIAENLPMRRTLLNPAELFASLGEAFRGEQRLIGPEPVIVVHVEPQIAFYGDHDLLLTALISALSALTAAAGARGREVAFTATANPAAGMVTLELTDRSLLLSEAFVRTAFTTPWPVPDADTVLFLLQSARRIAASHNGTLTLFSDALRTTVRLQLPADQLARPGDRATN